MIAVVIVSKTFTTAETMLNARTIKKWLLDNVPSADATAIIRQHMVAVRYLPTHYVCTLPLFHSCITDLLLYTMLLV